jgi:hypothetical protein
VRTLELGTPAAHARKLALRGFARALALAAVVALIVTEVASWTLEHPPTVVVVGLAAGVASFRAFSGPFHRARVGLVSEVRVARALRRMRASAIVHGALLSERGGDADHIVLGPICALVETKTGRGGIQLLDGGRIRTARRVMPKAPLHQAARQAASVTRLTGLPCTPIVCVVDMTGAPLQREGVTVCSLRDLGRVLSALPRVTDDASARRHAERLHSLQHSSPKPAGR